MEKEGNNLYKLIIKAVIFELIIASAFICLFSHASQHLQVQDLLLKRFAPNF